MHNVWMHLWPMWLCRPKCCCPSNQLFWHGMCGNCRTPVHDLHPNSKTEQCEKSLNNDTIVSVCSWLTWAVSSSPPGACVRWPLWAAGLGSCLCPDTGPQTDAGSSRWTCHTWLEGRGSILGGTKRDILRRKNIIKARARPCKLLAPLQGRGGVFAKTTTKSN